MRRTAVRLATGVLALSCPAVVVAGPVPLAAVSGAAVSGAGARSCRMSGAVRADSYGSGDFGRWAADRYGLPVYQYDINEQTDPIARQPRLGVTDAWSQLGNDHIVADAFNHSYVQLWDQDLEFQWLNSYDASARHYSGGYGFLRAGRRVISTRYDDRPAGAAAARAFGTGYFWQCTQAAGVLVKPVRVRSVRRRPVAAA